LICTYYCVNETYCCTRTLCHLLVSLTVFLYHLICREIGL
jgi:hypothetical protein